MLFILKVLLILYIAEVVRLGRDLRNVTRERDDLQFRYDQVMFRLLVVDHHHYVVNILISAVVVQLKRETDDIKKTLSDFGRLRSLCDNLQQVNFNII